MNIQNTPSRGGKNQESEMTATFLVHAARASRAGLTLDEAIVSAIAENPQWNSLEISRCYCDIWQHVIRAAA